MEIHITLGGIPFNEEVGDYLSITIRFCYWLDASMHENKKHMTTRSFVNAPTLGVWNWDVKTQISEYQGHGQLGAISFMASVCLVLTHTM